MRKMIKCNGPSRTVVRGSEEVSALSTSVRTKRVTPAVSRPRTIVLPVARPTPRIADTINLVRRGLAHFLAGNRLSTGPTSIEKRGHGLNSGA